MFKKIKDWWTEKLFNFHLSKKEEQLNKELDQNINMWFNKDHASILQEDQEVQQKYYNGLALLKQRLKKELESADPEKVLEKYKGSPDFYLAQDLLALAKDEDKAKKALREAKEAAFVYKGADVKSEEDKEKMVNNRIHQYYELHNKKEERELLRKARQAYKEGNLELHASLMKEWENYHGKLRNSKTRY